MTRIQDRKTRLQTETNARVQGRPLVVLLNGHELFIRQKARRTAFAVPYLAIWELGCKLAALERRRMKADARKGGR
jgi:hypothetical protein